MEWIVERDYAREALPKRDPEGHKGSFGEVLALAGSAGYTGAAWLTAEGAVRGGCGLVHLGVPEDIAKGVLYLCSDLASWVTGAALVGLSLLGDLSWWVTWIIVGREAAVTGLRFWVIRHGVIPASRGGKLKTLLQAVAIVLYLMPLHQLPYGGYAELVIGQFEQAACQDWFGFVVRNGENCL